MHPLSTDKILLVFLLPLASGRPQFTGTSSASSIAPGAADLTWNFIPSCASDCINLKLPELRSDKFDPCEKWGDRIIKDTIYGCVDTNALCKAQDSGARGWAFDDGNENACRRYSLISAGLQATETPTPTLTSTKKPTVKSLVTPTQTETEEEEGKEEVTDAVETYEEKKKGGLSAGAVAGIVIGALAGLALAGFGFFMVRNRKNRRQQTRSLSLEPTSRMPQGAPWEQLKDHPPTPVWLEHHNSYSSDPHDMFEPHDMGFRDEAPAGADTTPRIDVSPPIGGPVMTYAPHPSFLVEEPMFSPVSPMAANKMQSRYPPPVGNALPSPSSSSTAVSPMTPGEPHYNSPPMMEHRISAQPPSITAPIQLHSRSSSVVSNEPPFSSDPAFERWSNRSPSPVSQISRSSIPARASSPGNLVRADSVAWRRELEGAAERAAARIKEQSRVAAEQREEEATLAVKKEGTIEKLARRISGGDKK